MFHHKSVHKLGLDFKIFNAMKTSKYNKDYYLYIYDYAVTHNKHLTNFYNEKNNMKNTWNYELDFCSTSKKNIMNDSILFGFGDYKYDEFDTEILVKGIDHTTSNEKYYQAHIVKKTIFDDTYDKNKYIGQKIIRTDNLFTEELNIYLVRNLETRFLETFCVLCLNNTKYNINRKKSKCEFKEVPIEILGNNLEGFLRYMDSIKLDYGRVELIKDKQLGWCVIDINNSPGGGPLTNKYYNNIVKIFKKICL
jgi:hypothetical protein